MSAALVMKRSITTARVAFDSALSRLGCTRTVSAIEVDNTLCPPGLPRVGGRAGTGRQSRFRSWCSKERGGSSPSARIAAVAPWPSATNLTLTALQGADVRVVAKRNAGDATIFVPGAVVQLVRMPVSKTGGP